MPLPGRSIIFISGLEYPPAAIHPSSAISSMLIDTYGPFGFMHDLEVLRKRDRHLHHVACSEVSWYWLCKVAGTNIYANNDNSV